MSRGPATLVVLVTPTVAPGSRRRDRAGRILLGPCSIHPDCVADPLELGVTCKRRRLAEGQLVWDDFRAHAEVDEAARGLR